MRLFAALLTALMIAGPALAADYALELPITLHPGLTNVQRIDLPAAVLAASRSPDLGDLRVLDANGEPQMIERLNLPAGSVKTSVALPALLILGRPGALKVTGVELRLDGRDGARVARIDGAVEPAAVVVLGTLFDTRSIEAPAASLTLEADLPIGQPVLMQVDSSDNLRDWQPLAEKMVYRAASGDAPAAVAMDGARLKGRYLRLRWRAEAPLVSPIMVRGATLVTEVGAAPVLHRVPMIGAERKDAHDIRLAVVNPVAMAAIDIVPARTGMLVPVTISGRVNREAPWTELGSGTVLRLQEGGKLRRNAPLPLRPGPISEMRITADSRTAGFVAVPEMATLLPPVTIVFIASGKPPYRLAVGQAGAKPAWLAFLGDNAPSGYTGQLPPAASVAVPAGQPSLMVTPEPDFSARRLMLWAVLLLGTAALAAMVFKLRRG